jgi:ABC-type transport system substrate-binding protein/tRNA A-37 threonylcarbamoyl transferase component Bud32
MIGTRLVNRYEIVRELGRGGMGVVYHGRDALLGREVAIKFISPGVLDEASHERFRREARVVAQLDHPGIVGIHDFAQHDGALFYVMPFVRGDNLREFARMEKLTLGDLLEIFRQVAEALDYSHASGVVHRDIKPENVMLSREADGRIRVRITDFGLAVAQREQRITASGFVVGTLAYLAPEQLAREEPDSRSDIYALGTLTYELLTGDTPFAGSDLASLMFFIANTPPSRPSEMGVAIPAELEMLVMQCIEKDRARRPQRAADIAEGIVRCKARLRDSDALEKRHQTATLRVTARSSTPVIGRQKELAVLQQRLSDSATQCRFVLIGGPAGIGRTRLVEEIERLAGARRVPVLHATVGGMEHALPFASLCTVIEEYFRILGDADFSDLAPELVQRFPILMEIPELRDSARAAPVDRSGDRMSVFDVLARAFIRMASARPLLIVIEDLHHADITVEALQHIVARMAAVPVLIIATYRSDETDRAHPLTKMIGDLRAGRHVTYLELAPLSLDDHRALVTSMLGGGRIEDEVVQRTFAATEGNPHFATELVRSLLESREIVQSGTGTWRLASDAAISADSLPATIQQAVERRLDRLPEPRRALLAAASLVGRTFDARELAHLTGEETESVEAAVDELLAFGFLEEERPGRGDRLAFKSGIVRDVLYAGIPRRRRRSLHRMLAEYIEERHARHIERMYPQLLHHYARADVPEKVVEFGLRFIRASLDNFSAGDAVAAARVVLEFVEDNDARRAEARVLLAEGLHLAGRTEEALPEIDSAVRLLDRLGDSRGACAAATIAAEMAWQRQKLDETRRWVEKGVALTRRAGDEERQVTLFSLGAAAANLRGDAETAAHYLEEVERLRPHPKRPEPATRRGTLQVAFGYPIGTLEPATTNNTWSAETMALLFDTLTSVDETARVAPRLAESVVSENGSRRFRVRLREGARFHDGRPATVDDVRYSLARFLRRADAGCRCLLDSVVGAPAVLAGETRELEGVRIVSPWELVIDLMRPLPAFPLGLSYPALAIVPGGTEDLGNDWKSGYVGTGPFRLAYFEPGRRIELEANPHYWRPGFPRVDRLTISLGVPSAEISRGFRDGRYSLAFDLTPDDFKRLRHDRDMGSRYAATPSLSTCFIALNARKGPLRDPEVRRQIFAALDVATLVEELGTIVLPAAGLFPPGLLARHGAAPRPPEKGSGPILRQELQAGLFSVFRTSYAEFARKATGAIATAGFRVSIVTPDRPAIMAHPDFDIYFGRYFCDYPDTDGFAFGLLDSSAGILGHVCSSPEIDRLLESGRQEANSEVRRAIYQELERAVFDQSLILPLFHEQTYCFARPEVEGFGVRRFFPSIPYAELSLREFQRTATTTS